MSEMTYMIFFVFFLSFFLLLIFMGLPAEYQVFTMVDLGWLVTQMTAVTIGCVEVTGAACIIALGLMAIGNYWLYIVVSSEWIKIILFTPLLIILWYVMMRLARGI